MIYSYARVLTDGQSVKAQVEQLTAAGAEKVYRETAQRREDRPRPPQAAVGKLTSGDVVMVTRLDRVARLTRDLLNILASADRGRNGPPLDRRHMVGHDHGARSLHVYHSRWFDRVRTRAKAAKLAASAIPSAPGRHSSAP
jgi:hypothetical protein